MASILSNANKYLGAIAALKVLPVKVLHVNLGKIHAPATSFWQGDI
jgi:hypothetical protein